MSGRDVLDVSGDKHAVLVGRDACNFAIWSGIDAPISNVHRVMATFGQEIARYCRKHLVVYRHRAGRVLSRPTPKVKPWL